MVATLFCLHALGSSARSFDALAAELKGAADVHPIDLPGFGTQAAKGAATVEQMADHVVTAITATGAARWFLAGHSMGGKIATVVASRALPGFAGIALLAASPPTPEPMEDERRERMLSWLEGTGQLTEDAPGSSSMPIPAVPCRPLRTPWPCGTCCAPRVRPGRPG